MLSNQTYVENRADGRYIIRVVLEDGVEQFREEHLLPESEWNKPITDINIDLAPGRIQVIGAQG